MRALLPALALMAATPAAAEVVSASPTGFDLRHEVQLTVPPAVAYAAFGRVGSWWSPAHTYSRNAANLRLALVPGGCFCERTDNGGGVEYMRVVLVDPGKRVVLNGALGPLLTEAATGIMDVQVERLAAGSRLILTYRAAGFARGNADQMAPAIDSALADLVKRLRTLAANSNRRLP